MKPRPFLMLVTVARSIGATLAAESASNASFLQALSAPRTVNPRFPIVTPRR